MFNVYHQPPDSWGSPTRALFPPQRYHADPVYTTPPSRWASPASYGTPGLTPPTPATRSPPAAYRPSASPLTPRRLGAGVYDPSAPHEERQLYRPQTPTRGATPTYRLPPPPPAHALATHSGVARSYTPRARSPVARRSGSPLSFRDEGGPLIPPQALEDKGKVVVVLDLDETLVWARNGPVVLRPGAAQLLQRLRGRAEVVVWTAGEREYAVQTLQQIDPLGAIQHCIFRHHRWWTGQPGYAKNLSAIGRPAGRVLLVDNTPDCLREQPMNALLVSDFLGHEQHPGDRALFALADVLDDLLATPHHHVADVLESHPRVLLRTVPCDSHGTITTFTLADDHGLSASVGRTNFDLTPYRSGVSRRF